MVFFILFFILLIVLFTIAIFSLNFNIVISFFASTSNENLYDYNVYVKGLPRFKKKKQKKKRPYISFIKKDILNNYSHLKEHVEFDCISINGCISCAEADITALACGVIYQCCGYFIGILSLLGKRIDVKTINIIPIYSSEIYAELYFECILKFNLGNVIYERLKQLKGLKKNVKSN